MDIKPKVINSIDLIIIHCSATPQSMDIGVTEIDRWHRDKGWFHGCGYHYVIRRDGTVETGPRMDKKTYYWGAHAYGFNERSIGICVIGGVCRTDRKQITGWDAKPIDNFTATQYDSLKKLLNKLKKRYPKAIVLGHCDLPGVDKKCPCFCVKRFDRGCPILEG